MNLDDAQRQRVAAWVGEGLKLSEIQSRIASELGVRLTYMEVRLLVDDLKLTPKDVEAPKPPASPLAATEGAPAKTEPDPAPNAAGNVLVNVDQVTRPGAVVSGNVEFSDGNKADWYFDRTGRLGLIPRQAGYRPSPSDLQQFRGALESTLSSLGL